MKYCTNCGAALEDSTASFCAECGKPLSSAPGDAVRNPVENKKAKHGETKKKKHKKNPEYNSGFWFKLEFDVVHHVFGTWLQSQ